MKLRAQNAKDNTPLDFNSFLLVEFSLDRAQFVPDRELSCSQVAEGRELEFFAQHKANSVSDPTHVIGNGGRVFLLPDPPAFGEFEHKPIEEDCAFRNLRESHFNWKIEDGNDLREFARSVFDNLANLPLFSRDEVFEFISQKVDESEREWLGLFSDPKKKGWKIAFRKYCYSRHVNNYGEFNQPDLAAVFSSGHVEEFIVSCRNLLSFGGIPSAGFGEIIRAATKAKFSSPGLSDFFAILKGNNIEPLPMAKYEKTVLPGGS